MGHNLNMTHDFLSVTTFTHNYVEKVPRLHPVDNSSCTNINGIMDYYGVSNSYLFSKYYSCRERLRSENRFFYVKPCKKLFSGRNLSLKEHILFCPDPTFLKARGLEKSSLLP